MTDEPTRPPKVAPIPALLVPADPDKAVSIIDLPQGESSLTILQQAVGGHVEVQAHDEGDIWLNDEGRLIDLPINVRVNHWMLNDSTKAHHNAVGESMVMYGDVVITGPPDRHGDITAVSQNLFHYFHYLDIAADAMKDWDVRSTDFTVTFEPLDPPTALGDLDWNL